MNQYGQGYQQYGANEPIAAPPAAAGAVGVLSQGVPHPPYVIPFSPTGPVQAPRRSRTARVVGIVAAAVLVLGVGGAYGVSKYAESKICDAIQTTGAELAGGTKTSGASEPGDLAEAQRQLTSVSKVLLFHSDLQDATELLADDFGRMDAVDKAGAGKADLVERIAILQSLDTHFRQAQQACGLPADGIMGKIVQAAKARG